MRTRLRSIAVAFAVAGMLVAVVPEADAKILSLTAYKQAKSNWCWATGAQMVIKYMRGTYHTQCSLVKAGIPSSSCTNSSGNIHSYLDRVYSYAGMWGGNVINQLISQVGLRYDIDRYKPVTYRIGWKSCNLSCGHHLIGYGYYTNGTYWADPWDGLKYAGSYSYLGDNGRWKTTNTRYNKS